MEKNRQFSFNVYKNKENVGLKERERFRRPETNIGNKRGT